jgi:hypothetical protein
MIFDLAAKVHFFLGLTKAKKGFKRGKLLISKQKAPKGTLPLEHFKRYIGLFCIFTTYSITKN